MIEETKKGKPESDANVIPPGRPPETEGATRNSDTKREVIDTKSKVSDSNPVVNPPGRPPVTESTHELDATRNNDTKSKEIEKTKKKKFRKRNPTPSSIPQGAHQKQKALTN